MPPFEELTAAIERNPLLSFTWDPPSGEHTARTRCMMASGNAGIVTHSSKAGDVWQVLRRGGYPACGRRMSLRDAMRWAERLNDDQIRLDAAEKALGALIEKMSEEPVVVPTPTHGVDYEGMILDDQSEDGQYPT